jgi:signal transduction histidine kinase
MCQLIAEYRALRASILRLWDKSGGCTLSELTRFNEAVDEAMMEATVEYSATIEETRDQFLGVLGHDLRNPLAGIMMWAASIKRSATQGAHTNAATRIINSAGRMERMVNDLLDLTRTRLGAGIPIIPQPTELAPLLQEVLDELAAGQQHNITVDTQGDLRGVWDRDRLAQVISNLIGNAVQHGSPETPVHVRASGTAKEVTIEVHNWGPAISPAALPTVFEPMVRHAPRGQSTSLGLGLYIARELVASHGGTIRVTSTADEGTTFRVCQPRVSKRR